MKTESFNLSKNIITLLEKNGIITATPIQKKIIPAILEGRDVLAQSETGSGKTISFAIPIIEQIQTKDDLCALILVPTRELCTQVTEEFVKFSQGKRLGITAVYGGVSIENQIRKLRKTNIIIATPGRLIDLINRQTMHLDKIKFLVFDEADRMLDMGFIHDIEIILKRLPKNLQTMLFSATVSKEITELSKKYLKNPIYVILKSSLDPKFLQQTYYQTTPDQKIPLLIHLLKKERDLSLIFCNRKHITSKLADKLTRYGIQAKCLHGDMSQNQRERVTSDFRNKRFNILIATDVASRGLHIEDITHVYNFEIPKDVDSYTHRVGRTARAGKKGNAISLVTNGEEQKFFKQILFNYRGNITLKTVSPDLLPKIEVQTSDRKRTKEKFRHRDDKPFGKKEKSKYRGEEKTGSFRKEKFRHRDDKTFEKKEKSKYRGEEKTGSFRKENFRHRDDKTFEKKEKSKYGREVNTGSLRDEKKKSFKNNKFKNWGKNKPDYFGKKRSDSWDESLSLILSEKKITPADKNQPKIYSDNKSGTNRKNKQEFFGKRKSNSWEDRKPKFWSEGKSNKRLRKK
jgi:ATP-dependent RNA helicase DeaD